jgi:hypothetical protein
MGSNMKTTIGLSDALFLNAKQIALQSQTTLRALIEEGLRRVLNEKQAKPKPAFKLAKASVKAGKLRMQGAINLADIEMDEVLQRQLRAEQHTLSLQTTAQKK